MDCHALIILACTLLTVSAWSGPFYPVHRARHPPLRVTRYAPDPRHHRIPIPVREEEPKWQRPKRDHEDYDDHAKDASGVTGPVHTFVKTDKNANYKWGVRHHVGNKYA
ncbi:uncharacterized protein [Epargyreus clarus]|uniref:uncharacterized protein n=1 Tax=Epargyreus clarus TaxID=520877 RepID=UPI003C2F4A02